MLLAHLLFGNKLDLNRGILTPHLRVGTHSRSTYIDDLISVQDKVLDSAVKSLMKADAKQATVFYVGILIDRQLVYTLRGMARTVLSLIRGQSMFLQTL